MSASLHSKSTKRATDARQEPRRMGADVLYAPRALQRQLENFLACDDEWPAYRQWVTRRAKKLYERALKWGSPQQWAEHLGLAVISRSERTARERHHRVETQLRLLFRTHRWEYMPSRSTLHAVGDRQFTRDLVDSGGIYFWSVQLHVPIRSTGVLRLQQQTEYELRKFLGQRTQWPSRQEFEAAGLAGLLQAIYQREGSLWWAKRLGISHPHARPRRTVVGPSPF